MDLHFLLFHTLSGVWVVLWLYGLFALFTAEDINGLIFICRICGLLEARTEKNFV
jgi:hypothetical protein